MLKKVLFALEMLKIKALKIDPYPLYVNLVVNSRCNLNCIYCFGHYHDRNEDEYSLEEIKNIIDTLKKAGTRYILIQGGEPFIRNDLNEIIGYIDEKGIIPALVTNGIFVNRVKKTPNLKKMDNICISLDGLREGNDRQRGKGVFDKVMEFIQEVRKYHPKLKIRTNAVITKYTVDTFKEYLEFCWNRNIEVQVSLLFKDSPLAASPEKLRSINEYIYRLKKQGAKIVASSSVLKYVMDWPFDTIWVTREEAIEKLGKKAKECQYGHYEIIVDSDGSLYPCNALQGIFQPKNLKTDGFDQAFQHLQTKPCYTCNIASMLDTSEIINWNLGTIIERVMLEIKSKTNRFKKAV
jgi:MoaA/NifB/PqqE/SkfB family radical SAM enzyme